MLLVSLSLAACEVAPPSGGGSAPVASPPPPTGSTAPAFTPWQDLTAPEGTEVSAVTTGDLDGDGAADLVVAHGGISEIWFGPLAAGSVVLGASRTRVEGEATVTPDLDGDGRADLWSTRYLLAAPAVGTTVSPEADRFASFSENHTGVTFADVDLDGEVDAVDGGPPGVILYGPLSGDMVLWVELPGPTHARLEGDVNDGLCYGAEIAVLPDVSGDGFPEVWMGRSGPPWQDGDPCPRTPGFVWSPGNARNRALTPSDALVAGLPDGVLGPDADGDGVRDLLDGYTAHTRMWSLGAAITTGALAAPILESRDGWMIAAQDAGDLDGAGISDVHVFQMGPLDVESPSPSARYLIPSPPPGVVEDPVSIGIVLEPEVLAAIAIADLSGDEVPELLTNLPGVSAILDGASVRAALGR